MNDPTRSYYLRLSTTLSRELRHRSIEMNQTMNAIIVTAITRFLETEATEARSGPMRAAQGASR